MTESRRIVLRIRSFMLFAIIIAVAATQLIPVSSAQQTYNPNLYSGLRWRNIGPFRAGRVNAVSGVIGQPSTYYFGSVGGGVWKSTNSGRTWTPIFDSESVGSIGGIGVAPSDPNIVYVGTGEADLRDSISFGNGMYKSIDAGKTWKHLGLENTRQISRVLVDPKNPNVVFVAVLGNVYGSHSDRGVYRSKDGGATWQKVLYKTMTWVRLISHSIPLTHKRSMRACGTFVVHHGLSMLRQMVLVQVSSNQTTVETLGHNSQTACRLKVLAE
jgi:hypothetical protein